MYLSLYRFDTDSLLALEQRFEDEQQAQNDGKLIKEIENLWSECAVYHKGDPNEKLSFNTGWWRIGHRGLGRSLELALDSMQRLYMAMRLDK